MKKQFIFALVAFVLFVLPLSLAVTQTPSSGSGEQTEPGPYMLCGCYPDGSECITPYNTSTNQYDPCPNACSSSNCEQHAPSGLKKMVLGIQGKLINKNDVPVSGDIPMTFKFYNQPTGGDLLTSVSKTVHVSDGFFSVSLLLNNTQAKMISVVPVYVEVVVNGEALKPRIPVSSTVSSFNSYFLGGFTPYDFVKRAGDTMLGDLFMNSFNITGANMIQAKEGHFNAVYESGEALGQKYQLSKNAISVNSNVWCNNENACYKYTIYNTSKEITYGRVGLGNFDANQVKAGYVNFPVPLPSTPVVIGTMESCEGDYLVNIQSPSKYGFWFRIKNLGSATNCNGGIFLNFIALTYGGTDKNGFNPIPWMYESNNKPVFCYYDGDGDGYYYNGTGQHAPQWMDSCFGNWKDGSQVIGPDCDDTDASKTTDCPPGTSGSSGQNTSEVQCLMDQDGDGYGKYYNVSVGTFCAENVPSGDCNDGDASVHPGATEYCNGIDDNCDGQIDNNAQCPSGQTCIQGQCVHVGGGPGGCTPCFCYSTGEYGCLEGGSCVC